MFPDNLYKWYRNSSEEMNEKKKLMRLLSFGNIYSKLFLKDRLHIAVHFYLFY